MKVSLDEVPSYLIGKYTLLSRRAALKLTKTFELRLL
jgi:hypothetical protein